MFDPNNIIKTVDKNVYLNELQVFKELYSKGFIYRDHRIIFWSADEQRIVELEDIEEKAEIKECVLVKFPIVQYFGEANILKDKFSRLNILGFLSDPWKYTGIRVNLFDILGNIFKS